MSILFLTVLNMSLTASYVILFVIIVRLLLKKAPKVISYALWSVAAFRLIIPFSFKSMFSLMPCNINAGPIPLDIIYQQGTQLNSGIEAVDSFVSKSLPVSTAGASVNPLQIYVKTGAYIWAFGMAALLVYSIASVMLIKRQLEGAQIIEKNIFEAENLKTPFVLGLVNPRIYIPAGLGKEERAYVLLHEQTHIHRKDHIIKALAFLILSIHWFNPLVWIAFMLLSTDMELSCDERVLRKMNNENIKKLYANSLLSLAAGKHILSGSPLSFGEGNVKVRIKNILNYKRPAFWLTVAASALTIAVAVGLFTNPITARTDDTSVKKDSSTIESIAQEFINNEIHNYEQIGIEIIDSKISLLELVAKPGLDNLADRTIYVFLLEYRLLPKDLNKAKSSLSGGKRIDEEGWITEWSSMGQPLIVAFEEEGKAELIGFLWTAEISEKNGGLEAAVKTLLEYK